MGRDGLWFLWIHNIDKLPHYKNEYVPTLIDWHATYNLWIIFRN